MSDSEDPVLVLGFESGVNRLDELQAVSFLRFWSVVTMQDCWLPQMTMTQNTRLCGLPIHGSFSMSLFFEVLRQDEESEQHKHHTLTLKGKTKTG